jgi:hypothetical protein
MIPRARPVEGRCGDGTGLERCLDGGVTGLCWVTTFVLDFGIGVFVG